MARQEIIEFLAQLDYLAEGPKLWSLQDSNHEEHIQEVLANLVGNLQNHYSTSYVKARLWQEFAKSYTYPDFNFPGLFLHGSSEIDTLDPDERDLINERLKEIRLQKAFQSPRSRRSRSVLPAAITTPNRSCGNSFTHARPPKRSNAKSKRSTSVQKHAYQKATTPLKAASRAKSVSRIGETPPIAAVPSIEIGGTPSRPSSISASVENVVAAGLLSATKPVRWQEPRSSDENYETAASLRSDEIINDPMLVAISTEDHAELISTIAEYKNRYEEAEQKYSNLKKELRQMRSVFSQTNEVPKKILRELHHKIQRINTLQKRLNSQEDLEPYLSIGHAHNNASTIEQLRSHFEYMKCRLTSITVPNESRKVSVKPLFGESEGLDILLSTVFPLGTQSNAAEALDISPAFILRELIQMLIGAAIHLWIFKSKYNSIITTQTPLLNKYRSHIATVCGQEGLCNLDIAVHQSFIQDKDFKDETMPRIASRLTNRLFNVLQCLEKFEGNAATKMKAHIDLIIRLAIQVRSLSLISSEDYDSVWPMPGTCFDKDQMETEHSIAMKVEDLVKLPLCPGLRAYHKEKEMVRYDGFGDKVATNSAVEYTVKAIVLA